MGSSQSNPKPDQEATKRKSLYQRFEDKKRGELKDEDVLKYTGKTKDEIAEWSETQPGVGRNQLSGKLALGDAPGLAGVAAADGFGGWGPSAEKNDANRGMRFPPQKPKNVQDSD